MSVLRNDECFFRLADLARRCRFLAEAPVGRRDCKTKIWKKSPVVFLLQDLESLWEIFQIWEELRGIELIQVKEPRRTIPRGFRSWTVTVHSGAIRSIHGCLSAISVSITEDEIRFKDWFQVTAYPFFKPEFASAAKLAITELAFHVRNRADINPEPALTHLDNARKIWNSEFETRWPNAPDYPELRDELGIADWPPIEQQGLKDADSMHSPGCSMTNLVRMTDRRSSLTRLTATVDFSDKSDVTAHVSSKRRLNDLVQALLILLQDYSAALNACFQKPVARDTITELRKTFDVTLMFISRYLVQHGDLERWVREPSGELEKVLVDRLSEELNAATVIAKTECRDRINRLKVVLDQCHRSEAIIEEKVYNALWEIPNPMPDEIATAVADRILMIGDWLGQFGDLERCKKLGQRISNWLKVTANGVGYDSPPRRTIPAKTK